MFGDTQASRGHRARRELEGESGWIMGEADDHGDLENDFDDFDEEDFDDDFDDDFEEELDDEYEVENEDFPDGNLVEIDAAEILDEELADEDIDGDIEPAEEGADAEVAEDEEEDDEDFASE